jgi:glutamine amidotransferase
MNVIIDYNVGNLDSIWRGLNRAGIDSIITNDINLIQQANLLILPGVGAFKDAMDDLLATGLVPYIKNHVKQGKPLIGVCLGMQLLFDSSTEFGFTKGLSLIPGTVEELKIPYKVPHMGWNDLTITQDNPVVSNINHGDYVYFVHSFYAKTSEQYIVASTDYGVTIPAIVQKNNVIGMQFHPEKSGEVGLKLLQAIGALIT